MGTWGVKLYDSDIALDIKAKFDDLRKGKTVKEITAELIEEHAYELDDIDCAPTFWFALADTQWNLGRLLPEVKEQALNWISKGGDLEIWEKENPKLVAARAETLKKLEQRLKSPQPPEKKISQYRLYKCQWKIGDVFAYQFNSEYAKDNGFYNKYIYFVKVGETTWHPGHIVPLVYFYKKVDDVLSDIDTLTDVSYIPQFFTHKAYEDYPNDKMLYLLSLLNTSSRIIPQKQLTYLGNIGDVERIADEDLNSYYVNWKRFEEYMIKNLIEWM